MRAVCHEHKNRDVPTTLCSLGLKHKVLYRRVKPCVPELISPKESAIEAARFRRLCGVFCVRVPFKVLLPDERSTQLLQVLQDNHFLRAHRTGVDGHRSPMRLKSCSLDAGEVRRLRRGSLSWSSVGPRGLRPPYQSRRHTLQAATGTAENAYSESAQIGQSPCSLGACCHAAMMVERSCFCSPGNASFRGAVIAQYDAPRNWVP